MSMYSLVGSWLHTPLMQSVSRVQPASGKFKQVPPSPPSPPSFQLVGAHSWSAAQTESVEHGTGAHIGGDLAPASKQVPEQQSEPLPQ